MLTFYIWFAVNLGFDGRNEVCCYKFSLCLVFIAVRPESITDIANLGKRERTDFEHLLVYLLREKSSICKMPLLIGRQHLDLSELILMFPPFRLVTVAF